MVPDASIPVVQLSIDHRLPPGEHHAIGRALAPLRDEGVLILGSGNVTHNLGDAFERRQRGSEDVPDWALRFDAAVSEAVREHDTERLLGLWPGTEDGRRSHPTPDHFFPLLYACGAADAADPVRFPVEGFSLGSLSMRSILFG
jgi:4,5-DOPA dioxygenase extradiol